MGISRRGFLATPVALAASQAIRAAERRPNVILIIGGTWRAQAVPWAGDTDVSVPNLARFAAQGVTFSRAYAAYARSERSRLCLLKGVFPHTLAMPDAPVEGALSEPPTLATVLRGAGYRTAAFSTRQADQIVTFVHSPSDAPFYVEWYMENAGSGLMERTNPGDLHVRENVPAELQGRTREDMAVFYARARTRDHDIGEVLEALGRPLRGNDNGLNDDTIVIFTSLHGEQFGSTLGARRRLRLRGNHTHSVGHSLSAGAEGRIAKRHFSFASGHYADAAEVVRRDHSRCRAGTRSVGAAGGAGPESGQTRSMRKGGSGRRTSGACWSMATTNWWWIRTMT